MKTGDEKTIVAYAVRDFVADSIEDIVDEMVTVLPKTDYHLDLTECKPTGRQISDYRSKVRKKPGRKTN